jgi:hypothetical protein
MKYSFLFYESRRPRNPPDGSRSSSSVVQQKKLKHSSKPKTALMNIFFIRDKKKKDLGSRAQCTFFFLASRWRIKDRYNKLRTAVVYKCVTVSFQKHCRVFKCGDSVVAWLCLFCSENFALCCHISVPIQLVTPVYFKTE